MFRNTFNYVVLILFLASGYSVAGTSVETSLVGKKIQIISTGTPRVYIYDLPVNDGCKDSTPVLIMSGLQANPLAKEIYSTLLAAKASGKRVLIQTTGCWSEYSTPVITSMYLYD
ncbi:hypothetical protein [Vibrio sp. VPAP30]|uniref:hypothetical protein n=1 Tax=Vibrio sp. VPAP30 TaxID=1647102 RepID=UPI00065A0E25|nr:hypothetical protein [Vibrio sp. VPAP30]KLN65647.1 hypothetical protein ZX61_08585 [Vibrio sp. VPAP30]